MHTAPATPATYAVRCTTSPLGARATVMRTEGAADPVLVAMACERTAAQALSAVRRQVRPARTNGGLRWGAYVGGALRSMRSGRGAGRGWGRAGFWRPLGQG